MPRDIYFKWLCDLVKEPDRISQGVLQIFHDTEFFEIVPNDHNRALAGLSIREEGRSVIPQGHQMGMRPCTLFEMMIGLSREMGDLASGIGEVERPAYWFWRMMDNLGLYDYTVLPFLDGDVKRIGHIARGIVYRDYAINGRGGLFPVHRSSYGNQQTTELWYQMQYWMEENL